MQVPGVGSCHPSPDLIIAIVLLQPAEPSDAGSIITILSEEQSLLESVTVCAVYRVSAFAIASCPPRRASLYPARIASPHAGKSVVNVILCGKCHSDKTERRNAIMASCQAYLDAPVAE